LLHISDFRGLKRDCMEHPDGLPCSMFD
jgi:hypothetical protein